MHVAEGRICNQHIYTVFTHKIQKEQVSCTMCCKCL